jgi:putative ABC transport system ATP-binding protein
MSAASAAFDTPRTVRVDHVNHHYGEGVSRNQVLFDNCLELEAGQLVIMTGPSGSGKTTLLSLIGALRSVQDGTIQILDRDLAGFNSRRMSLSRACDMSAQSSGRGQHADHHRGPHRCGW